MKTAEWTQALRSGNFKQTKRMLSDGAGGFCCLGVLCEVKGLQKSIVEDTSSASGLHVTYIFDPSISPADSIMSTTQAGVLGAASAGIIPGKYEDTMLEDLALSTIVETPLGGTDSLDCVLMSMNDEGKTFAEIADYIEQVQTAARAEANEPMERLKR